MKKLILTTIVSGLLFSSCTQVAGWFGSNKDSSSVKTNMADSSTYAAWSRDETITQANAYSDLFLDSNAVEKYISSENVESSTATAIRNFYKIRNYGFAWFNSGGLTEQAMGFWSLNTEDSATKDKKLKAHMDTLVQQDSLQIMPNDSTFVQTELSLTRELVQYASSRKEGLVSRNNFYYLIPAKKQDAMQLADSILNRQKDSASYSGNKAWLGLRQELQRYYVAAKDSSWAPLPTTAKSLHKGSKSPLVSTIKKRLQASGEYAGTDTSNVFNDSLITAIKDVQLRAGLKQTGVISDSLLAFWNVSPRERVQQILVNMNRLVWMEPSTDSNRLIVNIPSLTLEAYEGSTKVFEMPVVIGKEGTSTLMFSGEINQVVFSPVWNIPQSIVETELMPKIKADPSYLKKRNMEIVSNKDSIPVIRQLPGKDNALGRVKFLFPNSYDIFLHDTPNKGIFNQKDRAVSHGCIRVAEPEKLAQYLLRDQNEWTPEKIITAMNSGKETPVTVKKQEPVYITYLTAWTDVNGRLNFRNDVYGHDKEAMSRLFL